MPDQERLFILIQRLPVIKVSIVRRMAGLHFQKDGDTTRQVTELYPRAQRIL